MLYKYNYCNTQILFNSREQRKVRETKRKRRREKKSERDEREREREY